MRKVRLSQVSEVCGARLHCELMKEKFSLPLLPLTESRKKRKTVPWGEKS